MSQNVLGLIIKNMLLVNECHIDYGSSMYLSLVMSTVSWLAIVFVYEHQGVSLNIIDGQIFLMRQ